MQPGSRSQLDFVEKVTNPLARLMPSASTDICDNGNQTNLAK